MTPNEIDSTLRTMCDNIFAALARFPRFPAKGWSQALATVQPLWVEMSEYAKSHEVTKDNLHMVTARAEILAHCGVD